MLYLLIQPQRGTPGTPDKNRYKWFSLWFTLNKMLILIFALVNTEFPRGNSLQMPKMLTKRSAYFFCQRWESKHFRLCNPYSLYHNYSVLLQQEIRHRKDINKWVWLYYNKVLFTKAGGGPDLEKRRFFSSIKSIDLSFKNMHLIWPSAF